MLDFDNKWYEYNFEILLKLNYQKMFHYAHIYTFVILS
jgi:hypothetical protein